MAHSPRSSSHSWFSGSSLPTVTVGGTVQGTLLYPYAMATSCASRGTRYVADVRVRWHHRGSLCLQTVSLCAGQSHSPGDITEAWYTVKYVDVLLFRGLKHCSRFCAARTSKTSHAWSTSLRVGGTCTLTVPPSAAASAVSAMRSSKSAICNRIAHEDATHDMRCQIGTANIMLKTWCSMASL